VAAICFSLGSSDKLGGVSVRADCRAANFGDGEQDMPKINVIFHSVSGHTYTMAEAISEGVRSVSGCEAHIKRIPEPFHQEPIVMPGLTKGAMSSHTFLRPL
jgi:hypothetical protein